MATALAVVGWLGVIGLAYASIRLAEDKLRAEIRAANFHERMRDMADEMDRLIEEKRAEGQRYADRVETYEDRISELIRQNQNMAERVASLRLSSPEIAGGDDFHVEDVPPRKPYSADLQAFYDGLESAAQIEVEHFIEAGRDRGLEDEQILNELEREGTVL